MSSKSGDKRTYIWAKAKRTREGNSECTGKFHQSPEAKKVICRSESSFEARA